MELAAAETGWAREAAAMAAATATPTAERARVAVARVAATATVTEDDVLILGYVGAMPAEGIYGIISLIGASYWFAYFLIILPLLGVMEKPLSVPSTIEEDFDAHYPPKSKPAE